MVRVRIYENFANEINANYCLTIDDNIIIVHLIYGLTT
jgi:hypothetical protein